MSRYRHMRHWYTGGAGEQPNFIEQKEYGMMAC